jgi:hypothetical protein
MVATKVDVLAQMLGGTGGQAAGMVAKPWFLATVVLALMVIGFLFLVILMSKRTNGFRELRASLGGKRVCWFFDDTRTAEMKVCAPSAGIIDDEEYGSYIINEKGTYVDKRTRNIIIPFSSSLAVGAEVKHFQAADELIKLLGDEKELQKISLAMANGEITDDRFDTLRTSINFGALKSFANTMIPHNISAKIQMEIAKRLKSYGNVNGKQIFIYIMLILGACGLMALVLYLTVGGKGDTVIYQGAEAAKNLTGSLIG